MQYYKCNFLMLVNILVVLESHGFECVSADLFSHLLIQCSHKCTVVFCFVFFGTTRPFTTQASIYFTHIYTGDSVCITRCLLINWQKHSHKHSCTDATTDIPKKLQQRVAHKVELILLLLPVAGGSILALTVSMLRLKWVDPCDVFVEKVTSPH